mmetsp:Transcript_30042/g.73185  ORF Transcript_30042/g.73185 Transcript_30042/m.73185 type:complete len:147 (+) Transcript_30042:350-790(+)
MLSPSAGGLVWAFKSVPWAIGLAYSPVFFRVAVQAANKLQNVEPRKNPVPDGLASRAHACHMNQLETLPLYCGGIVAAAFAGVAPSVVATQASIYIIGRALYVLVYLVGENRLPTKGYLRSAIFGTAVLGNTIMLWTNAAQALASV